MSPPLISFKLDVRTTCLRCGVERPEPSRDEVQRALSATDEHAVVLEVEAHCRCGSNRVRVAWSVET